MIDVQAQRFAGPLRRQLVEGSLLNGIDYVEVDRARPNTVRVYFLKAVSTHAYGLPHHPERITISGGRHVTGLRVVEVSRVRSGERQPEEAYLRIRLDRTGDHSIYTLQIDAPELDPCLRRADFTFADGGPALVDCRPSPLPPPPGPPEPVLDYEAKDYQSFVGVLLDLVARFNPGWIERSPADLGITLVELMAYAGDRLSYLQDAVANEAYLDRVRLRVSARRLARLLDYHMHDGRNAWTWVQFSVQAAGVIPRGTPVVTRIQAALANEQIPPDVVILDPAGQRINVQALQSDPALASAIVFETAHEQNVDPVNNEIRIHDWGVPGAQLEAGATSAFLYSIGSDQKAFLPKLAAGDWLLLEEAATLDGGAPDPRHRQVVQIQNDPEPLSDHVFSELLVSGHLQLRSCPGARGTGPLPLLMVSWRAQDALSSAFLISVPADAIDGCPQAGEASRQPLVVARGNLAAADHGLTTKQSLRGPTLSYAPLTMQCPAASETVPDGQALTFQAERRDLSCQPSQAMPAIALSSNNYVWTPVPDLLESGPFDRVFVVEVDEVGLGQLRFGDGTEGHSGPSPESDGEVVATYRVGNGLAGQIGADTLNHVVVADSTPAWLQGVVVSNPLPAIDGAEPQTVDDVRALAPQMLNAQQRAVTDSDYRDAALAIPGVAAAAASFGWTGSWSTVFVGIQPTVESNGEILRASVAGQLERLRLAGQDVDVRLPRYVGVYLALRVTIASGHFRNEILEDVAATIAGLFAQPGAYTFGTPVYLSRIHLEVSTVEGVQSVVATSFHPVGAPDAGELQAGVMGMGVFDIARLENDSNHPELGALRLTAVGGKG